MTETEIKQTKQTEQTEQNAPEQVRKRSNYLPFVIGSLAVLATGIYVHRKLRKNRELTQTPYINKKVVSRVLPIANDNKYGFVNAILHMISHEPLIINELNNLTVSNNGKDTDHMIQVRNSLSRILNGDPDLDGNNRATIFSKYLTRSGKGCRNPYIFVDTFSKLMKDLGLIELFTFKFKGDTTYSGKNCRRYKKCPEAIYGPENPERYELPILNVEMTGECNVILDQLCSHTNKPRDFHEDELPELPELLLVQSSDRFTLFETFDININGFYVTKYKLVTRCACLGDLPEDEIPEYDEHDDYGSVGSDRYGGYGRDYVWIVDVNGDVIGDGDVNGDGIKYDQVWIRNGKGMSGKEIVKMVDANKQSIVEFGLYKKGSTYKYTNMFY